MESTKIKKIIFLIFNLFSFLFHLWTFLALDTKHNIQQYNNTTI